MATRTGHEIDRCLAPQNTVHPDIGLARTGIEKQVIGHTPERALGLRHIGLDSGRCFRGTGAKPSIRGPLNHCLHLFRLPVFRGRRRWRLAGIRRWGLAA